MIDIRPSILAADLMNLHEDISRIADHIEWLHFDVMDAHFVPNLSFGPALCAQIKRSFPALKLDVHLMMEHPEDYIDVFVKSGADAITVHAEAADDGGIELIQKIKSADILAGISVKPHTPVESLPEYPVMPDLFLIMTVEPGFGGQKFMPAMLEKSRYLRLHDYKGIISVDGGVGPDNASMCANSGVTAMVMGTAVFRAADPAEVIRQCKEIRYEK